MTTISKDFSVEQILAATELNLHPDEFMLVGINPKMRSLLEKDLATINNNFFQYIQEADVLTVLLATNDWSHIGAHYPNARVEGPLCVFTFSVAMDWHVVGFLAAVTGLLAKAGIPLGAVCGYYRDHLFIARKYAPKAEKILQTKLERCRNLAK